MKKVLRNNIFKLTIKEVWFVNLDFIRDDFRFNARTSVLIYNKEQDKVLLFNVEGRDFYMLPGGRIEELEESSDDKSETNPGNRKIIENVEKEGFSE